MELARLAEITELKNALRRITHKGEPETPANDGLPSGHAQVDALLGGGFPRGRVSEISGGPSSGKSSVALAAAARATQAGLLVAYVDGRRELYPPAAAALGVDLQRLLVVRPTSTAAGLARATEIVAQSRAFALIIVDLPEGRRLDGQIASRLRATTHSSKSVVVVLAPTRGAVDGAALSLAAQRQTLTVELTLHKGGARPPGSQARMFLGDGTTSTFRAPARQAELFAAAPQGLVLRRGGKQH